MPVPIQDGLVLHLESHQGISAGGGVVARWADQSGRGNDLTASGDPVLVAGRTPAGQPAIVFDGTGDLLQRVNATDALGGLPSGAADRTLFFVVRYVDPKRADAGLVYGDAASNETFGLIARSWDADLAVQGWGGANDFDSDVDGPQQGWIVQSVVLDDNLFRHFVDGGLVDDGSHAFATDARKLVIGARLDGGREAQMEVAAALIYDRALTEAERQSVEGYLQQQFIDAGASQNTPPQARADAFVLLEDTLFDSDVLANDTDPDGDPLTVSLLTGPANGALVLNTDGSFTYRPEADFTGTDSFTYAISDGRGGEASATVSLTISPVEDAAVAVEDRYTIIAGEGATIAAAQGVLANDVDAEGDAFTASLLTGPVNGVLQFNADGSFTYTPNNGFMGEDSFTYAVTGGSAATVTLDVSRRNADPQARPDLFTFIEDAPFDGDVLANDSDGDGDELNATLLRAPLHGALFLGFDGSFTYTPEANFDGTDTFLYAVADGYGGQASATVTLTGTPVDDPSVAVADSYDVLAGATLAIPAGEGVLANDADVEGDPLEAVLVTGPANGSLALDSDGGFSYSPDAGFEGQDSFTYRLTGGGSAIVSLNVASSFNTNPVAVADSWVFTEDTVLTGNVLANDDDPDADPLSAALIMGPQHGVLVLNANGTFSYTPNKDFHGTDSFRYAAIDGRGGSAEATVSLSGLAVNDPTQARADAYSVATAGTLTVGVLQGVLANDTDPDGPLTGATVDTAPARGTLQLAADGSFVYTPNQNFVGEDHFRYAINGSRADVVINVGNSTGLSLEGFIDESVITRAEMNAQTSNFQPISMAFLPDNRMLLLSKRGEILIVDPESGTSSSYLKINNIDVWQERGLLDITLDPGFASNGYFYLYYTPNSPQSARIARFQHQENAGGVTSTASLSSETVIWQDTDGYLACCHYGGGLDFGPDGKIWLTTSDKFQSTTPGERYADAADLPIDLTSTSGKIIRVNPDGSIPDGTDGWAANPWADPADGFNDSIWGYGLRNPFRARWDLEYGNMYIGEVGGNQQNLAHEDLHIANLAGAGAFYGWPIYEGMTDTYVGGVNSPDRASLPAPDGDPGNAAEGDYFSSPVWSMPHRGQGASLTGGEVYRGSMFPDEWQGAYFYGDYTRDYIRYLRLDSTGTQVLGDFAFKPSPEITGLTGEVVSIAVGNDGALYYAMIASGEVRRIAYDGNRAPVIQNFAIAPASGEAPLDTLFTATITDADGDPLTYSINFDDGTVMAGSVAPDGTISVPHRFAADGQYFVSLSVSDGMHSIFSPGLEIEVGDVNEAPIIGSIGSDLDVALPGEIVTFSASFSDPDGDSLSYTWHFGDGTRQAGTTNGGQVTATHSYANDGSYQVYFEITDGLETAYSANLPILVGEASQVPVTEGLVLLLQSDIKIGLGTGNTVVSWLDGSGQGNNLFARGDPKLLLDQTPTGQAAIVFDGTGDLLQRVNAADTIFNLPSGNQNRTVFLVVDYLNPEGVASGLVYGDGARNEAFGVVADHRGNLSIQGWGGDLSSGIEGVSDGFLVQSAVLSNGTTFHYRDGALIDSDRKVFGTDVQKVVLGAEIAGFGEASMKIAAALIYDRALSASERGQVETFLQAKYLLGNAQPQAVADSFAFTEDTVRTGNVLANDRDPDGDPLSASLVSGPSFGTLALAANGGFTYTPNPDFAGSDSFVYAASDGQGGVANATVTLVGTAVDDPGIAVADSYAAFAGSVLVIGESRGVMANDIDRDGDPNGAVLMTGPASGVLLLNANGGFTYTPNAGFVGQDSFVYRLTGGSSATATLNVSARSAPPVAVDDAFTFIEDTQRIGNVLANDSDPDGDALLAELLQGPSFGELVLNPDGSFSYLPDADYDGADSFTYRVSDGQGGEDEGRVVLTGSPVNDPARAAADRYEAAAGTPLVIDAAAGLLSNDIDVEGDPFTASLLTGPANGSLQLNANGGFSYTPVDGFTGEDQFTYRVTGGASANVVIDVRGSTSGGLVLDGLVAAFQSNENVTLGAGSVVAGWLDGSGRGNDLTALGDPVLVAGRTPTGQPAIVFDGTGDLLQRVNATDALGGLPSGAADRTLFFVVRYVDPKRADAGLVYGDAASNETFGLIARSWDADLAVQGWGGANDFDSDVDGPQQGWIVQSVVLDDNLFRHFVDGGLVDDGSHAFATDARKLVIGARLDGGREAQMEVAAALIYDRALTEAERQSVETYLQQQYVDTGFTFG